MRLRICQADEVPELLPRAMSGEFVLAPVGADRDPTLAMLRPQAPVVEPDAAVIVATSGSTGTPKGVVLSRAALEAAAAGSQLAMGGRAGHWHVVLPMHYVAGLMVVVRAWYAGAAAVIAGSLDRLVAHPGTPNYVSMVPTQLHRALTSPGLTSRLAGFDAILLGGALPASGLLDRAAASGLTVVTTYGMSETCGGVFYDGVALPGVAAQLGERGRITLSGPTLMSGYRLRPDLTAAVLTESGLLTSDWGEWVDGRLLVRGRIDDIVITGGVNVDLAAVQRAVDAVAAGSASAVVGVPDPEWGTRIALVTQTGLDLAWWRDRLGAVLRGPALPRQLVAVDSLPLTSSGKMDRRALARLAGDTSSPADKEQ